MLFLDKLERKLGWLVFPHLLLLFLAGQVAVYFAVTTNVIDYGQLVLNSTLVMRGEFWRLFTFLLIPKYLSPLFFVFFLWVFYLTGSKLQGEWGEFRYNLYFIISWFSTVLLSFFAPFGVFTNIYILAGFTLAFGTVFPEFEFRLYFLLPVKSKVFAWIAAGFLLLSLLQGADTAFGAASALLPYGLFFGKGLVMSSQQRKRSTEFKRKTKSTVAELTHQCSVCGRSDRSDPDLGFRYLQGDCICEECLEKRKSS